MHRSWTCHLDLHVGLVKYMCVWTCMHTNIRTWIHSHSLHFYIKLVILFLLIELTDCGWRWCGGGGGGSGSSINFLLWGLDLLTISVVLTITITKPLVQLLPLMGLANRIMLECLSVYIHRLQIKHACSRHLKYYFQFIVIQQILSVIKVLYIIHIWMNSSCKLTVFLVIS